MIVTPERLSVAAAAHRLGVKPETLYAYVSRGVLERRSAPDGRSWFDHDSIEELARRGRPRRTSNPPALEIQIETSLTTIADDGHRYRGHRATTLARRHLFESVAQLLWTGALPDDAPVWPSHSVGRESDRAPGRPRAAARPDGSTFDHLRMSVAEASIADPSRGDLRPEAVAARAATVVAALAAGLPERQLPPSFRLPGGRIDRRDTMAGRVWAGLTERPPPKGAVAAVNGALVLVADHELAPSALAARVAASTRADPYAVVGAGLGVVSGPLHGGASGRLRSALDSVALGVPVPEVVGALVGGRAGVAGFGHRLYRDGDPRSVALFELLRSAAVPRRRWAPVDQLIDLVRSRTGLEPNVDAGLAALGFLFDLPADTGSVLFVVGRSAGWLGHAIEEYAEPPLRFRPRAVPRP